MTERLDFSAVRRLFELARDQPETQRALFLERACAGQPELRDEVLALLEETQGQDHFLEPGLEPGARIGSFHVIRVLGQGGMGVVYEAEQRAPRRRVALKTVQPGRLDAVGLRRFRHEAELMARVRHPAIAEVYASDVESVSFGGLNVELPWYAMEFVDGARTLTDAAKALSSSRTQRIRLFLEVCRGVHHAHTRGVIHRDLKPDNVLVGNDGSPKIIDFGVARATDAESGLSTLETAPGRLVGTIAYMSPEQIVGDRDAVGVQSDVYALGVLLYELLSEERPHDLDRRALPEAARMIANDPPRRPSRLAVDLVGDLETILLTSVERDLSRRYASVAALQQDLQRWLGGEPIAAHAPSWRQRLHAVARRHKVAVAAGLIVFLALVSATVISTVAGLRAARSGRSHRALFEQALERSVALTDETVSRLHQLAGGAELAREMLEESSAELETLLEQTGGDPVVRVQLARTQVALGDVLGNPVLPNLGLTEDALARYARAGQLVEGLVDELANDSAAKDELPNAEAIRVSSLVHRRRATIAHWRRELDTAQAQAEIALELTLRLVELSPQEAEWVKDLAFTHDVLAQVAGERGDLELQEREARLAREQFERYLALGGDPEVGAFQLAMASISLGAAYYTQQRYPASADEFAAAARELELLVAASGHLLSRRDRLAWARTWEGSAAYMMGDLERAESALGAAAEHYERLSELDSQNLVYPPRLANAYHMLGSVELGRREGVEEALQGEAHLEAARAWRRRAVGVLEELEQGGRLGERHAHALEQARGALMEVEEMLGEQ